MVFVNSQKFACASCIKGHRSSSCLHTDRPLFEIKKKGRPISQCDRCRELRKSKRMHVKCTCVDAAPSQSDSSADVTTSQSSSSANVPPSPSGSSAAQHCDAIRSTPRRPASRQVPSTPTLPNGLQDLWSQRHSSPLGDIHPKQRVDSLLNPCNCKSVWKCKCSRRNEIPASNPSNRAGHGKATASSVSPPLQSCCKGGDFEPNSNGTSILSHGTEMPSPTASLHRMERHLAKMPYAHTIPKFSLCDVPDSEQDLDFGLDLPPLKSKNRDSDVDDTNSQPLPSFKIVCSSSTKDTDANAQAIASAVASLTRCGCGSTCICPGCKEHRGKELATESGEDCPDKCGSCIDHMGGISLPVPCTITLASPSSDTSTPCHVPLGARSHSHPKAEHGAMSTLDHVYSIAALLPQPPPSRVSCLTTFDPTNVAVYQQPSGSKPNWRKAAGLVQVPSLNCCDGRCKCPGGKCGCGAECGGSCGRHDDSRNTNESETGNLSRGAGKENGGARRTEIGDAGKQVDNAGNKADVVGITVNDIGKAVGTRSA